MRTENFASGPFWVAILLCVVLLTALNPFRGVGIEAAPLLAPSISVSPSSGLAGSTVTVTGSGFTGGFSAAIRWEGTDLQKFTMPKNGSFSEEITIPSGASPGPYTISVCSNCGGGEFEESASVGFKVTEPSPPTSTPEPTSVPPKATIPPIATIPTTSLPISEPGPPFLPDSICGDLGLGPEAEVLTFDPYDPYFYTTYEAEYGVRFDRSAVANLTPRVAPHSGELAAKSREGEFGSSMQPIRMLFIRPLQAVGMFVGMEEPVYVDTDVAAVLTVYGLRAGESDLVQLGSDSVSFPALATNIVHCLRYTAEEGDIIVRATLDYVDTSGLSIFEPRWMDDLTMVYAETELPPDLPPQVEITEPEDGAPVIVDGAIGLRAEIVEDRELWRVFLSINSGPGMRSGFLRSSSDPTLYRFEVDIIARSMLRPNEENTLTVIAEDLSGQRDIDSVSFFYESEPEPGPILGGGSEPLRVRVFPGSLTQHGAFDVFFSGSEFQDFLVARKDAMLRLPILLLAESLIDPIPEVYGAELIMSREDGEVVRFPAMRLNGTTRAFDIGGPFRDLTLMYFYLPGRDLPPGEVDFELQILDDHYIQTRVPIGTARFYEIPPQYQFFAPMDRAITFDDFATLAREFPNVARVYPVPNGASLYAGARSGTSDGLIYAFSPSPVVLPRGFGPGSTTYNFAWEFIQEGSGGSYLKRVKANVAGRASASGTTTTLIDFARSVPDGFWVGQWIRFTSGENKDEVRQITGSIGVTGSITFGPAVTAATATGDGYKIIPGFDCSDDGVVSASDIGKLGWLVDGDGDGAFDIARSIPRGGLLMGWAEPEDLDGDGSVSQSEMANYVVEFNDADGDGGWYLYADSTNRGRFSPGDPYLWYRDSNRNCEMDGSERASMAPARRRMDNASNYMKIQAQTLMVEFALGNGLPFMPSIALVSDEIHSISWLGNCGRSIPCWIVLHNDGMVIAHEVGHGWGLEHVPDAGLRIAYGAVNLAELRWVRESDTRDFMFRSIGDPPANNFANGPDFEELFRYGLADWPYGLWLPSVTISTRNGSDSQPTVVAVNLLSAGGSPTASSQTSDRSFAIFGVISRDGEVSVWNSFLLDSPAVAPAGGGEFSLVFQDVGGGVLSEVLFDVSFDTPCDGCPEQRVSGAEMLSQTTAPLLILSPFPEGATKVQIRHGDQVMTTLSLSETAPVVEMLLPSGGDFPRSIPIEIRWRGVDPDGDPLVYTVSYSRNGGETYIPLATGLQEEFFLWDPISTPGSRDARLRVTASDGFHRSAAVSSPFSLEPSVPSIQILRPEAGSEFGETELFVVEALAIDLEDGKLTIEWRDQNGAIVGTEARLVLGGFSIGQHTFTAGAWDGDGNQVNETISFKVVESPPSAIESDQPFPGEVFVDISTLSVPSCTPNEATFTAHISDPEVSPTNVTLLVWPSFEAPLIGLPMPRDEIGLYTATLEVGEDAMAGDWNYYVILLDEHGVNYRSELGTIGVKDCQAEVPELLMDEQMLQLIRWLLILGLACVGFAILLVIVVVVVRRVGKR